MAYREASSPISYLYTGGGGFPDAVSLTVKRDLTNNKKRCIIETMKPRPQSFYVEADIANDTGWVRGVFIAVNRCLPKPYGCGGDANEFNDEPSEREYAMSGLCQKCQDKVFGD